MQQVLLHAKNMLIYELSFNLKQIILFLNWNRKIDTELQLASFYAIRPYVHFFSIRMKNS